jgi:hypothetical protein
VSEDTPAQPVKRKTRTIEERQAKLEAELDKLREQARLKDQLTLTHLKDQQAKLVERIRVLQVKNEKVTDEIREIEVRLHFGDSDE